MQAKPTRALPLVTPLTQPFWDAASRHELVIQRCQQCGHFFHPPVAVCIKCLSSRLAYEPVSGRGRIHARTVMHDGRIRGFGDSVPFALIAVELHEQRGLLMVTNLLDAPPEDAQIGREVTVDFEPMGGGFVLPQFRLAGMGGAA